MNVVTSDNINSSYPDKVIRVPAASYLTAGLDDCNRLYIQVINLALSDGLLWQTYNQQSFLRYRIKYVDLAICDVECNTRPGDEIM